MKTRADVLQFISGHIVHGKGVKIQLDGEYLRLQLSGIHHIWHNDRLQCVVAVINLESFTIDMADEWAKQQVEFYDL